MMSGSRMTRVKGFPIEKGDLLRKRESVFVGRESSRQEAREVKGVGHKLPGR